MSTKPTDYDTENPFRYPLGLPNGSVRALLTLIIVGVICQDVVAGKNLEPVWVEALMVALAHYFTTRRFVRLPPETLSRLEAEGVIQKEPLPLYLPRGTIRCLILASFIGVGIFQYQKGLLFRPETMAIFFTLLAYFTGTTFNSFLTWWNKGRTVQLPRWWSDSQAVIVLGFLIFTSFLQVVGQKEHLAPHWLENVTMSLVLFYFGSR